MFLVILRPIGRSRILWIWRGLRVRGLWGRRLGWWVWRRWICFRIRIILRIYWFLRDEMSWSELKHRKRSDHGPKSGEDFGKNQKIVFAGRWPHCVHFGQTRAHFVGFSVRNQMSSCLPKKDIMRPRDRKNNFLKNNIETSFCPRGLT